MQFPDHADRELRVLDGVEAPDREEPDFVNGWLRHLRGRLHDVPNDTHAAPPGEWSHLTSHVGAHSRHGTG